MKMVESSPKVWKTLLEKEKLLVMSNFSFSNNVFKRLLLQTRKNQGLFGKGLRLIHFNPLPNNKILDRSKSKAFADYNIIATQNLRLALGMVENIVGKGENAGIQHFLLFPQCFQKASFSGSLKVGIVW